MFTTTHRSDERISRAIHATLICVALVAFSACGKSSSSPSSSRETFTVTETTPTRGEMNVARDREITVRFSADLAGQTVTTESFRVTTAAGPPVAGEYLVDARTATFRPLAPFPAGEMISVTLTDAIESASGVRLEELTFGFTVAAAPPPPPEDPEPVTLIAVQPSPFAQSVEPDAVIEIEFSAPVEADSVTAETIWVSGTSGGRYPVFVQIATPVATSARIVSSRDWLPGEVVSVSILDGVVPTDELPFAGYTYSFRVATAAGNAERSGGDRWIAPGVVEDFRLGDLDGDGRLDLVYYVEGGSTVEAVQRFEDGSFSMPSRINVGQLVTSLELADLDGDSDADLIVGSPDRAYTYLSSHNGFSLAFSGGESYVTRSAVHSITAADINHHGGLDVVLNTDSGIQVFLDDDGANPTYSTGDTRMSNTPIRCADLDLDGRLDLVYGALGFNLITYHLAGPAAGEFGEAVPLPISHVAADVAIDDFTGDGRPDLLALLSLDDAGPSPIELLPQFGELEFEGVGFDIVALATQSAER